MNSKSVKIGDHVTTSGYPGVVVEVCEWSRTESDVMVEVRLDSGVTCVTCHDINEVQ